MKKITWRKHHKWLGLILGFFIIMFSLSGLILNHPMLFADINSIDLTHIEELYRVFGSNKKSVNAAITRIRETIGCVSFDPRYLGEEGFVTMLYSVVDRKSRDHRS